MKQARAPVLPVALMVGAVLLGHLAWAPVGRRIGVTVTVDQVISKAIRPGMVVRIADADLWREPRLRTLDYDSRDPKAERAYAFGVIQDPANGRMLPVLFWRSTFPNSRESGAHLRVAIQGTLRATSPADRQRLLEHLNPPFQDPRAVALFIDDMEFPQVGALPVVAGSAALAALLAGVVLLVQGRQRERQAGGSLAPGAASATRAVATAPGRSRTGEATRSCRACHAEFPGTARNCLQCKAPVDIEYFVAAALPFEGFERYVPVLTGMLRIGDYQATQPLARVHSPYPYQHLDGFHAQGPGANAPLRLIGRGIPSLVTARALATAIKEKGKEAVVVGSDELEQGPFPRPAAELRYDDETLTLVFWDGPDREERSIRWSRVALVLFSAAMPLRGTLTLAREVKENLASETTAYLIDIYERDNPEGVRIAEHSFHRWEFLKTGGSERPGDRFGKLIELVEQHAREADIQYLTGAYRGPRTEWRFNFYSRLAFLMGTKAGWSKEEGPPRLEGYEVLDKLGEGGMGAVYRARQKKLGRMVALKVISPHLAAQPQFAARFQAEARAVAALAHPNIVQVIDLAESGGRQFLAMEFVEGRTLLAILKEKRRLPEPEALRICLEVARALDHAWQRGILHRDVKPENIFVSGRGEVKLGDWGLAKDMERDLNLTDTGTTVGTPYYMSPEQARARKDLDVRSDLYALGATLYHLVTGQPPFRGNSPMEVIAKHLSAPAPDPRGLCPALGEGTTTLIRRLLAKRPEERCADAAEVILALEGALAAARAEELVLT